MKTKKQRAIYLAFITPIALMGLYVVVLEFVLWLAPGLLSSGWEAQLQMYSKIVFWVLAAVMVVGFVTDGATTCLCRRKRSTSAAPE